MLNRNANSIAKLAAAIPWDTVELQLTCITSIFPNQIFFISWHAVFAASNPTKLSLWRTFLNEKMYFMYCRLSRKIKTALLRTIVHSKSFFRPSMGQNKKSGRKGQLGPGKLYCRFGKQLEKVAKLFVMTFAWCSNCQEFYGLKAQQKMEKVFTKSGSSWANN